MEIRFRHGVSIDEFLLDPNLADEFEQAVKLHSPNVTGRDARLGALYLRKSRNIPRGKRQEVLENLDPSLLDAEWSTERPLSDVHIGDVPSNPGLIEVREGNRWLYVVGSNDLHRAVASLTADDAFGIMTSSFWKPVPNELLVIS